MKSEAPVSEREKSRSRAGTVVWIAIAFVAGVFSGGGVAMFRLSHWATARLSDEVRGVVVYELETLSRFRLGRNDEAIGLLEGSMFQGATSLLRSSATGNLTPKERRVIQLVKLYGDRTHWTGVKEAEEQLRTFPTDDLDLGTCSTALRQFLSTSTPGPSN